MKINVISDIHIAKKWDVFKGILPKKTNYLNPNKELKNIISSFDKDDLLEFNGDLIDYYYSDYFSKNENNWDIFIDIIKKYKGKMLLNTGNHDYRKTPYNFSIFGLNHINIDDKTRKKYKNIIGFCKFRFFNELNSIKSIGNNNPILNSNLYNKKKLVKKDTEILLLNTGPDSLNFFSELINPLRWIDIFSNHPTSYGLTNYEINILEKTLNDTEVKNIIIFMHCPPFLSKSKIKEIKLNKLSYNISLLKNGLTYLTFGKNNRKFIELLINAEKNIIVVSSHSHIPKQYIIDKQTKILRDSKIDEINSLYDNSNYVKFVSNLPLGAIGENKKIGYLTITNRKIKYKVIKEF